MDDTLLSELSLKILKACATAKLSRRGIAKDLKAHIEDVVAEFPTLLRQNLLEPSLNESNEITLFSTTLAGKEKLSNAWAAEGFNKPKRV